MEGEVLQSARLVFREWRPDDLPLARTLWGDPEVMRYLDVRGALNEEQLRQRFELELETRRKHGTCYWPMFQKETGVFVGACGLKPWAWSDRPGPEMGFYLARAHWGKGYAREAGARVIRHAFEDRKIPVIMAGHHPGNHASKILLERLGFVFLEHVLFKPTGLRHPSYRLTRPD